MILTLQIIGPQVGKVPGGARKVFDACGGSIGRQPDNDWVLTDQYVSNRHAFIRYEDGRFFIEDVSTNGICVNSADNRVVRGEPYPLHTGDWIFIEPFEIRVDIADAAVRDNATDVVDDPFAAPPRPPSRAHDGDPFVPAQRIDPVPASVSVNEDFADGPVADDDWLKSLIGGTDSPPAAPGPRAADLRRGSPLADYYRPAVPTPSVVEPQPADQPNDRAASPTGPALIPEDWESSDASRIARSRAAASPPASNLSPAAPSPPARPRPSSRTSLERHAIPVGGARSSSSPVAEPLTDRRGSTDAPAPRLDTALADVLAGAGLNDLQVTPEVARSFGAILRIVIDGVMRLLEARQRFKSEFRLENTVIQPHGNNPLKFSANVGDALHNLLVKRNAAYVEPIAAFEDAFDDLTNHQLAMMAGLRAALEAMLAEFDADRLQQEFDRQGAKGALLSIQAKARYWDMYRERVQSMLSNAEGNVRALFGQEFVNAYDAQLKRLRAQRRATKPEQADEQ